MKPTELICIFSLDVRVTKRNFRVLHHDGDGNKGNSLHKNEKYQAFLRTLNVTESVIYLSSVSS